MVNKIEILDLEDGERGVQVRNLKEDNRPSLTADIGGPDGIERIFYPPKEYVNENLNNAQLVTLMKKCETVPVMVGMDMMFVGWEELRLFFGTLLDKFLVEHWGMLPTDLSVPQDSDDKVIIE